MQSIASNFVITHLIITLNNLLHRTMRLINPVNSDFLEDPNEFSSRIYVFLIQRDSERTGNIGTLLGRHLCPLFSDRIWLFCDKGKLC